MDEIEKKYLVNYLPNLDKYKSCFITQIYLSTNPEIRIRKMDHKTYLTYKSNSTSKRKEIEFSIPNELYNKLSKIKNRSIIEKLRYFIPLDNYTVEVDIYYGHLKGLVTAEVEFESIEMMNSFIAPSWFGTDITEDKDFKNKNLALKMIK